MFFICENIWEKFIQITISKFKINNAWFMSSNSRTICENCASKNWFCQKWYLQMCFICENMWEKFIQITSNKFKINNVWFMSSNSKPYVKMCFISENIWEKFIRITIYKFKMSNHLLQIYGLCHPVRRNVKILHLKTGSVKCRIWKQGVGCKYVCLNCKNIFFWQLYDSCHLVQRSTQTHMKIVLPKTGSVKNENTCLSQYGQSQSE